MTNFEKYKKEIKEANCNFYVLNNKIQAHKINSGHDCIFDEDTHVCFDDIIKWLYEEYKEPLLTNAEKEYLLNVIKPFKHNIDYIHKNSEIRLCAGTNSIACERFELEIVLKDGRALYIPIYSTFKGLEVFKQYTLDDLGL